MPQGFIHFGRKFRPVAFRSRQTVVQTTIVCPKIIMQKIKTILVKNTHTGESAIEWNERETIQDNFIHALSLLLRKVKGTKTNFLRMCWHLFSIQKSLRRPRRLFKHYHMDPLQYKISFSSVLKPDKLDGAFQKRNLGNFPYIWINIVWTQRHLQISNY